MLHIASGKPPQISLTLRRRLIVLEASCEAAQTRVRTLSDRLRARGEQVHNAKARLAGVENDRAFEIADRQGWNAERARLADELVALNEETVLVAEELDEVSNHRVSLGRIVVALGKEFAVNTSGSTANILAQLLERAGAGRSVPPPGGHRPGAPQEISETEQAIAEINSYRA